MNNQTNKNDPINRGHFDDSAISPELCSIWLGWRDSNPRMLGPKPSALPLGDTLILVLLSASFVSFRTNI
jgi:hypothetical protein